MSQHLTRGPRCLADLDRDWTWSDMLDAHRIIDALEAAAAKE